MMQLQQDWIDLRNSPINTFEIEMAARDFYLNLDYEPGTVMENIFEAKHTLESARILVANLIDPHGNKYINTSLEAYNWLMDNIGRIDRFFDESENTFLTRRDMTISLKPEEMGKESFFITNYVRKLDVMMKHLVYYPLRNAYLRFQKPFVNDGKEVEKDEELFCYFVFIELFKSSQSLGNIMYEKKKPSQQSQTYEPPTDQQTPPEIPSNVKTKEQEKKVEDTSVDDLETKDLEDQHEILS